MIPNDINILDFKRVWPTHSFIIDRTVQSNSIVVASNRFVPSPALSTSPFLLSEELSSSSIRSSASHSVCLVPCPPPQRHTTTTTTNADTHVTRRAPRRARARDADDRTQHARSINTRGARCTFFVFFLFFFFFFFLFKNFFNSYFLLCADFI